MSDKRSNARVPLKANVTVHDTATDRVVAEAGEIKNISTKGFMFVATGTLGIGKLYRFRMNFGLDHIELAGRILSIKQEPAAVRCRVRIEAMSIFRHIRLNRFLAARSTQVKNELLIKTAFIALVVGVLFKFVLGQSAEVSAIGCIASFLFLFWFPFI
jgi:hypothetical protein